jgi:CDP-paratose 2-epimerase
VTGIENLARHGKLAGSDAKILILGGAGFIGCNAARRFLERGAEVIVVDNLSRKGARENVRWLNDRGNVFLIEADIRDAALVERLFREHRDVALVLHLAGQVSVTSSIADPRTDFEINVGGTINALEAARKAEIGAPFIYASTNKVYGDMSDVNVELNGTSYRYCDRSFGISEQQPLDFHSPYACSKGAADQYVLDYHRIYGLNTVVFRQSCVYGLRQFGIENQGWVAWFAIAAELGKPITIYGDGMQVRDLLFAEDLVDAYEAAAAHIERVAGSAFNIGGGPENGVSLLELLDYLGQRCRTKLLLAHAAWRPGDQRIYLSDIRRAREILGWSPRTGWRDGVARLTEWVRVNRDLFG